MDIENKGEKTVARIDKAKLTRTEIFCAASKLFLTQGYTNTSIRSISNELEMSTGNVTFYYPTKEHILAELIVRLCDFQGRLLDKEAGEGYSSMMGICLEIATMAVTSECDEKMRDIFLAAYTSPLTLEIIRRNDTERAKSVFAEYCKGWTDEDFAEAETLVSGIEYATFMKTGDSAPLEARIKGAIRYILKVYSVPSDIVEAKIKKILALDYKQIGKRVLSDFIKYVEQTNERLLEEIIHTS